MSTPKAKALEEEAKCRRRRSITRRSNDIEPVGRLMANMAKTPNGDAITLRGTHDLDTRRSSRGNITSLPSKPAYTGLSTTAMEMPWPRTNNMELRNHHAPPTPLLTPDGHDFEMQLIGVEPLKDDVEYAKENTPPESETGVKFRTDRFANIITIDSDSDLADRSPILGTRNSGMNLKMDISTKLRAPSVITISSRSASPQLQQTSTSDQTTCKTVPNRWNVHI